MSEWSGWFDGATDGSNPGPAGIGVVLREAGGQEVNLALAIGHASSNEAEYRALLMAMRVARDLGCTSLLVRGDSQLVINQVFGSWKCNADHLRQLRDQARSCAAGFLRCHGEWIPRDNNEEADALSKQGALANTKPAAPAANRLSPR